MGADAEIADADLAARRRHRAGVGRRSLAQGAQGLFSMGGMMNTIVGRRLGAPHRRIAACLRELEPDVSARINEEDMRRHVLISDRTGRELGLASEVAHGDWAYLMLMTHGRIAHSLKARAFVTSGERPPDTQVRRLLTSHEEATAGLVIRFVRGPGNAS